MRSSLENDILAAWGNVRGRFERDDPEPSPEALASAWSNAVEQLRATFAAHVGPAAVAQAFAVPEDYALFTRVVGGGWKYHGGWGQIYGARRVAEVTAQDCENCADDRRPDDGLWLDIGRWGSKRDYLLCCDRGHRLFGVVVEGEDAHPWLNSYRAMWVLAPTFLGFLRDYLPGRACRPSKLGPSVSVADWLVQKERPHDREADLG